MKRLIISENEKKEILNQYTKKIISEGLISQIFKNSGPKFEQNFGLVSTKQAEDLFTAAFKKFDVNIVGGNALKSKSGKVIPFSDLDTITMDVMDGKLTPEKGSMFFPEYLADGTPFREKILGIFKSNAQTMPHHVQIPYQAPKVKATFLQKMQGIDDKQAQYNYDNNLPDNWRGSVEGYNQKMEGGRNYSGSN